MSAASNRYRVSIEADPTVPIGVSFPRPMVAGAELSVIP